MESFEERAALLHRSPGHGEVISPVKGRQHGRDKFFSDDTRNSHTLLIRRHAINHSASHANKRVQKHPTIHNTSPVLLFPEEQPPTDSNNVAIGSETSTESDRGQDIARLPPYLPPEVDGNHAIWSEEDPAYATEVESSTQPKNKKKLAQKLSAPQIVLQLTTDPLFRNEYFEVSRSVVAGFGAIAVQQLRRGDIILVEEPLLMSDEIHLFESFEGLDHDERKVALGLHKHELLKTDTPEIKKVWSTNSFATSRPGTAGLFAIAGRFNHACHPAHNIDFTYDSAQGCLVLTVRKKVVDIGTELTICYGRDWTPEVLYLWYGFSCSCGACVGLSHEEMSTLTAQW